MNRTALGVLLLAGCAVAGVLAAAVLAAPRAPAESAQTTGTTGTTGTTTGSTTTGTTEPPTVPPAPPDRIAAGVAIGGVGVGGLSPEAAKARVRASVNRPLRLVYRAHRFSAKPAVLGARAAVSRAVERALRAAPGTKVRLSVSIRRARVRSFVARVSRRLARPAVDATLSLRNLRPWITPERSGRALRRRPVVRAIVAQLAANRRRPIALRTSTLRPRVTRGAYGPVIVIRRGSNRLHLYDGMRPWRIFGVATGQAAYPTPLGRFSIVTKWRNPWWFPPKSAWAAGASPIPPGPGNPLGTRWMGLSISGVGIHGTPNAASIGYSASHGCIRMHIRDAEWLFDRVSIGTTVFIVAP